MKAHPTAVPSRLLPVDAPGTLRTGSAGVRVFRPAAFLLYKTMTTKSGSAKRKGPGRPATGAAPLVGVRFASSAAVKVDAWAHARGITRSEAIRRLIELGLEAAKRRAPEH